VQDFEYAAPTTLPEATALLARHNGAARVLAGGTDLIAQLRERLRTAQLVVDVKRIPELMELHYDANGLRLGAATPCYRIYEHAEIAKAYSALADAARIIGGWQIQSRASVGGNLCNASPAGDTIAALLALQAVCVVAGPSGTRKVPAGEFCVAPGKNILQPGELLVSIEFPPPSPQGGSAYERFIPRNEMDIAVAGVASWVGLDPTGGTIERAAIGLAAIAPTPQIADQAGVWLSGRPATEATFAQAGELAKEVASPIGDMRGTAEFRVNLVGVLTRRTLARAVARARGEVARDAP